MKTPQAIKARSTVAVLGLMAVITLLGSQPATADRYDRSFSSHPLKYMAYPLHAVGIGLEYFVARPIHWVVSRDNADILFGHYAQAKDDDTYFEWTHGNYQPSVAVERAALRDARQQLNQLKSNSTPVKPAPAPAAPKAAAPAPVAPITQAPATKPAEATATKPASAPATKPAETKPQASAPTTKPAPVVDVTKK